MRDCSARPTARQVESKKGAPTHALPISFSNPVREVRKDARAEIRLDHHHGERARRPTYRKRDY